MNANKQKWLTRRGLHCGVRDPQRNRAFAGAYMVAEPTGAPLPTDDASDGAFCIVGDNLNALVEQAFAFLSTMEPDEHTDGTAWKGLTE